MEFFSLGLWIFFFLVAKRYLVIALHSLLVIEHTNMFLSFTIDYGKQRNNPLGFVNGLKLVWWISNLWKIIKLCLNTFSHFYFQKWVRLYIKLLQTRVTDFLGHTIKIPASLTTKSLTECIRPNQKMNHTMRSWHQSPNELYSSFRSNYFLYLRVRFYCPDL